MPLFSDLSSYYYSSSLPSTSHYYHMPTTYSVPSRIATPFSFSYLSPLTAMMSAGAIGGINPMPRGLMSRSAYTPILPSISETSSPILSRREIVSPRTIGGKVYYRAPRPVVIDTANIDVSKRKKDKDDDETSTAGKIHRGRSVVRMHTKKLKENPGLKKKKTQGELLMEKFLIKEKPEPKEEPRRRRVWETDRIPEDTTSSPLQVTPTVSPSATPVCRRGTIKRYISGVKKKSGPLPDVEGTEEGDASERKVLIDELLKEEAAILDSMIQEELDKPVNEMPTKRKISGELPDIDEMGTKHKTKTKREGKLYGGKKSSKTLPLDSLDKSGESISKHYISKKSSKALPLDAVNEATNSTVNKVSEDNSVTAEEKQSEEKVKKSCKSYKKKHTGPLKFRVGSVHVEETSSPNLSRKLNYEVIIEERTHGDGTMKTLRDIKKRKSKKPSVKRYYSVDQKAENEDIVGIHNDSKSERLANIEAFDSNKDVTKLIESLDNSSRSVIKDEINNEKCVPENSVEEKENEVNKFGENSCKYDGTKLAVKNFLEKIVHKTDLPHIKDDMKHKTEKDTDINKKSDKTKYTDKGVQNDATSKEDYYDKFKSVNMLLKNVKEKSVTVDNKNEVVGISAECKCQDESKQRVGASLSTAQQGRLPYVAQPNTELKNIDSVGKVNNEKIIPDVIKNNEEEKTATNVQIHKETKVVQKNKEVPGFSEQHKPAQISDKHFLPSKTAETTTGARISNDKEKNKPNHVSDKFSVKNLDITSEGIISESVPKTLKTCEVGEKTCKVSDNEITKVFPIKTETSTNVGDSEKIQEKTGLKMDVKYQSDKPVDKSTEIIVTKHSQNIELENKQNLDLKKQELSSKTCKIEDAGFTNTIKGDNLNLTSDLMSPNATKHFVSEKDDILKDTKSPTADTFKFHDISKTLAEEHTKVVKKDYQDVNKSTDLALLTSQNEEKVTVGTNTTDKITTVDSKQLALAKKTKPKPDAFTHEVVHESTKIDKCMVGDSSEATLLSGKHVDSSQAIVNSSKVDAVTSSVEIHPSDSKQVETNSSKENRDVNLDSSVPSEVGVSKKKEKATVIEDSSVTKILDSQNGSPSKGVNSSALKFDYFKPEVQDIQQLKEQVSETENICDLSHKETENSCETSTPPKVPSPDTKQPLLSSKTDVLIKASNLNVYDASKSHKTEDLSVAGSTSETVPAAVTKETDHNFITHNKIKQDKVLSPCEIYCEEHVKSELSGNKGKEVISDDTTKTVTIPEVKDTNKTTPVETVEVKKPDIESKPVPPKDLKSPPVTVEAQTLEKLKILDKSKSPEDLYQTIPEGKGETIGTVKENKAAKKVLENVTAVCKETEPGNVKKLVKSSSNDEEKQTESKSTVKVAKSPKSAKSEQSKPSPTKRKPLVKKKSAEEAVVSGNATDKTGLPKEAVTSTETSGKTVLPSETKSSQKKTETVAKTKVTEKTSVESSCVKVVSPKKINTVVKVKDTDKTLDKSVNCETNSMLKDVDVDKHSENVGAIPSPVSSSDKDSSTEEESSDEEETSSEEETSTEEESSDDDECDVNCHRKCEKLMPNLCGINQKLIVEALTSVKKASVESKDKGSPTRRQSNAALSLESLSSDSLDGFKLSRSGRVTPPATTIPRFRKYCIDDFQFLKVLGKGSFGKVLLAELKGTQYYYAVKCLKKDVVLEDDDVECTLIERKVLVLGTKHPYLCHLFCTFQTQSHLFFVMEYLNGGDLMFHIQQEGRFDEGRARFYAAEIVSGLKFLHKKGIIYRDLKLDNILLDFDGHVRIADFGMCKLQIYLDRTADTFCGTPDYMAPEIIKGLKYNQCVDWWSFGILLYEMLVGQSPFSGCDEDDLFWCICNRQPQYPRFITVHGKKILSQLLEKESSKRLGSSENGATDIMLHTFFDGLDWQRLERRDLIPPFKPNVKHPLDVQYFDKAFTSSRARLTPIEPSILQSMDQTQFNGFSYTNPNVTE